MNSYLYYSNSEPIGQDDTPFRPCLGLLVSNFLNNKFDYHVFSSPAIVPTSAILNSTNKGQLGQKIMRFAS